MKKLIIFDFDGVIVDTIPICYAINLELYPGLSRAEWKSWFEDNILIETSKTEDGEDYLKNFFNRYNQEVLKLSPVEGMVDIIKQLSQEYNLIIISSSEEFVIRKFLQENDLEQHFLEVLGLETDNSKVEKIESALKRYQAEKGITVMVTDTVGDVKEALKTGIKTIGVCWGMHDGDQLTKAGSRYIAKSPFDIARGIDMVLKNNL